MLFFSYRLVYIIFLIHGVAVLMPWNMFINATDVSFNNFIWSMSVLLSHNTMQSADTNIADLLQREHPEILACVASSCCYLQFYIQICFYALNIK